MKQSHPLMRGFALAFTITMMMVLLGTPRLMEQVDFAALNKPLLIFAGTAVLGAFVAAVPSRLRRLHDPWRRSTVRGCITAFIGGGLTVMGLQIAGCGDLAMMCGILQGGLGALAFMGFAWLAAVMTAQLTGRWQK